eukprot:354912-Chlamydomonas_euryale.AAC.1
MPEVADLSSVKVNASSAKPCECCLVLKEDLMNVKSCIYDPRPLRTEKAQKELLDAAMVDGVLTKDGAAMLATMSTHAVRPGLWGFAGGDTDFGTSTLAFGHDSLHVEDSGVFKYLINRVADFLTACELPKRRVNELIAMFNQRLGEMPRSENSKLPGASSKYFPETSNIQASEHRAVMPVRSSIAC